MFDYRDWASTGVKTHFGVNLQWRVRGPGRIESGEKRRRGPMPLTSMKALAELSREGHLHFLFEVMRVQYPEDDWW